MVLSDGGWLELNGNQEMEGGGRGHNLLEDRLFWSPGSGWVSFPKKMCWQMQASG